VKNSVQEANGARLAGMHSILHELEKKLITGDIFKTCLKNLSEAKAGAGVPEIVEQFIRYSKSEASNLDVESGQHSAWIKSSAIYVLNSVLFGSADKKVFKVIWELHKRVLYLFSLRPSLFFFF
jgi:hypothetical protein